MDRPSTSTYSPSEDEIDEKQCEEAGTLSLLKSVKALKSEHTALWKKSQILFHKLMWVQDQVNKLSKPNLTHEKNAQESTDKFQKLHKKIADLAIAQEDLHRERNRMMDEFQWKRDHDQEVALLEEELKKCSLEQELQEQQMRYLRMELEEKDQTIPDLKDQFHRFQEHLSDLQHINQHLQDMQTKLQFEDPKKQEEEQKRLREGQKRLKEKLKKQREQKKLEEERSCNQPSTSPEVTSAK